MFIYDHAHVKNVKEINDWESKKWSVYSRYNLKKNLHEIVVAIFFSNKKTTIQV